MIPFITKALAPKEVKDALSALDEAAKRFPTPAFQMVRSIVEKALLADVSAFLRLIRESNGRSPREWAYSELGNVAGDLLESGDFHVYRGVLNPLGPAQELLAIFDATYDELLSMHAIEPGYAREQKQALRDNMKGVG